MGRKPEWWRYFWVNASGMSAVFTVFGIASYLLKVWDLYGLAQAILLLCCADLPPEQGFLGTAVPSKEGIL